MTSCRLATQVIRTADAGAVVPITEAYMAGGIRVLESGAGPARIVLLLSHFIVFNA